MSASQFPDIIYGMKPAYTSSGLQRIYNKKIEVVKFVKSNDSQNRYNADKIYRYSADGTFREGKAPSASFNAQQYVNIYDGPCTDSPSYGVNFTLFYDQDMAYISKVQSIKDLKNSYTAELQRLQNLFDKNVPDLGGHDAAVQAIKEEHPEKFI
mgnify:CR=1 FL=1